MYNLPSPCFLVMVLFLFALLVLFDSVESLNPSFRWLEAYFSTFVTNISKRD